MRIAKLMYFADKTHLEDGAEPLPFDSYVLLVIWQFQQTRFENFNGRRTSTRCLQY